jgi:hypothetical protein
MIKPNFHIQTTEQLLWKKNSQLAVCGNSLNPLLVNQSSLASSSVGNGFTVSTEHWLLKPLEVSEEIMRSGCYLTDLRTLQFSGLSPFLSAVGSGRTLRYFFRQVRIQLAFAQFAFVWPSAFQPPKLYYFSSFLFFFFFPFQPMTSKKFCCFYFHGNPVHKRKLCLHLVCCLKMEAPLNVSETVCNNMPTVCFAFRKISIFFLND